MKASKKVVFKYSKRVEPKDLSDDDDLKIFMDSSLDKDLIEI